MWSWRRKTEQAQCPLIQAPCRETGCTFWQKVIGKDPQSKEKIEQWDCAVTWHNVLLIENSLLVNQAVASIQRSNNDTVTALGQVVEALATRRRAGKKRF